MNKLILTPLAFLIILNVVIFPLFLQATYSIQQNLKGMMPNNVLGMLVKGVIGFALGNLTNFLLLAGTIIVGLLSVAIIVGIRITAVGGLADVTVETIVKVMFLGAIYGLLSIMPFTYLLAQLDVVGTLLAVFLTIMYFVGVVSIIRGGASD